MLLDGLKDEIKKIEILIQDIIFPKKEEEKLIEVEEEKKEEVNKNAFQAIFNKENLNK